MPWLPSGVHFRGGCFAWNMGAHRAFDAGPGEDMWLCPDCSWDWVRLHRDMPRVGLPTPGGSDAIACMSSAASISRPGAGCRRVHSCDRLCTRAGRRWLLRTLRDRGDWMLVADIEAAVPEHFGGAAAAAASLQRLIGLLVHEQMAWCEGFPDGPRVAARL